MQPIIVVRVLPFTSPAMVYKVLKLLCIYNKVIQKCGPLDKFARHLCTVAMLASAVHIAKLGGKTETISMALMQNVSRDIVKGS